MSQFSRAPKEYKLSEETAQASVMRILDYYEIDIDAAPEPVRPSLEAALIKIRSAFREGVLEIVDPMTIRHHLRKAPGAIAVLDYGEFTGKNKRELDGFGPTDTYKRMHAFLGSITGLGSTAISALAAVDLSIAEALALVFLSA
jgi:hypothetical protein